MNTSYKRLAFVFLIVLMTTSVFAFGTGPVTEPQNTAEMEKVTLVGTLTLASDDLSIDAPEGSFAILIGKPRYAEAEGLKLWDGMEIFIFGYAANDTVVPMIIVADGEAVFLRDTDGTPLWRDSGHRFQM